MAIKKDTDKVAEKNGMEIVDNMNGEKRASDKLDSMMAKSNVSDIKYEIYKKALREDRVKDIFPNEPQKILMEMYNRFMKETGGKIRD